MSFKFFSHRSTLRKDYYKEKYLEVLLVPSNYCKRLNRIQQTSDFILNPYLSTWWIRFLLWKHILLLPFTKSDFGSWCQDLESNTCSLFIIQISPSFKFQQILYYIYTWPMLGLYTQLSICSSTMPPPYNFLFSSG